MSSWHVPSDERRRPDAVLEVEGLSVRYETASGEIVDPLRGLDLTVGVGEMVAVFGPSGSGKSTLLKAIMRVVHPGSGTVRVRGIDIGGLTGRKLAAFRREEVGFVPQTALLVAGVNVAANAALPLMSRGMRWEAAVREVLPLLERLDLTRQMKRMPGELSEGERQRVAIASALCTEPRLLVADEPTGRLDPVRAQAVRELLAEVSDERGIATLLTTHDAQARAVATRSLMLHEGVLVAYAPSTPEH